MKWLLTRVVIPLPLQASMLLGGNLCCATVVSARFEPPDTGGTLGVTPRCRTVSDEVPVDAGAVGAGMVVASRIGAASTGVVADV